MGELHVNMNITLDGVIQANGGPTEQDGDFEYAGWERSFWDAEFGDQINGDVQVSAALLLGRTTRTTSSATTGRIRPARPGGPSAGSPSTSRPAARQHFLGHQHPDNRRGPRGS